MMTERFRRVVDRAAQLPPDTQDALARALEEALEVASTSSPTAPTAPEPRSAPTLSPDVREAFERVIQQHAASLAYLKDR